MTDSNLPIDPRECDLTIEQVSAAYATLNIKVPAALVKRFRKKMRRAGHDATEEELRAALTQFCVAEGTKGQPFRVVTTPGWAEAGVKHRVSTESDFVGSVGLDIALPLKLPDFATIVLDVPDAPVTDEMVEDEVRAQCRMFGQRAPGTRVERGSECVLDAAFQVGEGERPVVTMDAAVVTIPDKGDLLVIQSQQVTGLVDALCGAAAGETRTVKGRFPENIPLASLQGKAAVITVKVREVRTVKPAPVEQVLKEYGMPNEARLRTQIRFALEDKRERDTQSLRREQMAKHIIALYAVDVPVIRGRLMRAAAERELLALLKGRGLPDDAAKAEYERLLPETHARADEQSRLYLILRSIAPDLALVLDEDVVAGRLAAAAAEQGMRPEALRAELVKSGKYRDFIENMGNEVALDKMLLNSPTRTIPSAEWEARRAAKMA